MVDSDKNQKTNKKDLHISFRINQDMLRFYEELLGEISGKVGISVPQSRIMRAMIAVTRDREFREEFVGKISEYLKESLNNW